ncbi:GNAT family N-acetyltransferase [Fodinisporobacter ferrooxydans]|uniref:GNAT family N-acetyltransferase n=1 Tax=Fodinisporobacter ferrooxydans TaxID=2901836 RepID=A0ABY4CJS5_9BACL|nr:GNAT family N-acetyltransferase [Alicyclobacillaceae bacterium MYW30-H2]
MNTNISYRVVTDLAAISDIVHLQEQVWAANVVTSLPQLVAAIHHGGVVIGAFAEDVVVGFCYGFPGFHNGEIYLFSHMMGIDQAYRDLGIGRQLKFEQRTWALTHGYTKIRWTFDPLEARNAYLNIMKLGGYVDTYIEAYYGEMSDPINKGLPTDRFLLEWDLHAKSVEQAAQGQSLADPAWNSYPSLVHFEPALGGVFARPLGFYQKDFAQSLQGNEDGFLLPVPVNIHSIKQQQPELAKEWRFALRHACTEAFQNGCRITGMLRREGPVHAYVLQRQT